MVGRPLALLTGGGAGIGRHLVDALIGAGYVVAFLDRVASDAITAPRSASDLRRGNLLFISGDVGIKADVERFVDEATRWVDTLPSLVINNAGVQTWSSLLDLAEERWDEVIRTNLKGCFLLTQAVARRWANAGRGGAIVNIGSGCNKLGFPNLVDYTSSKGGIEQLTKSAAIELGRYGITVNCVAPGAIETARTATEAPDYAQRWAAITPLGRVGTPADVAGVVLFLASPAARFVTGQTIWVDGGVFTRAAWPYPDTQERDE